MQRPRSLVAYDDDDYDDEEEDDDDDDKCSDDEYSDSPSAARKTKQSKILRSFDKTKKSRAAIKNPTK